VANGPHNYTADANIGNWPSVVGAAQKLTIKYVLPGHGVPGGTEVLAGQANFMKELHSGVKKAIGEGKKVDDIKANLKLSDSVKNWVGPSFKQQVQDAYEEISQNKPHGEILGGK